MSSAASQQALVNVFRRDPKNVGDWWSVPTKFFQLGGTEVELLDSAPMPEGAKLVVVGGGGLGRANAFANALRRLDAPGRAYGLVAWGVGSDTVTEKLRLLPGPTDMDSLFPFFDMFDLVGTRIDPSFGYPDDRYVWVPCASCMSPLFDSLRDVRPTERIGVYRHLRVSAAPHLRKGKPLWDRLFKRYPTASNSGTDLESKLRFMARFETIVTNSYHGVYWATLLNRKVVCLPFKNGLFSFRHPPSNMVEGGFDTAIANARNYPDALQECRTANIDFFSRVSKQFGVI